MKWMNFIRIIGCVFLITLLTGCAFTRTQVNVSFSPTIGNPLRSGHTNSLEVGAIKDSRPVTDEYVLIQKGNAYGATSGAFVTDEPIAKIFQNGLKSALAQNGFLGSNSARYTLKADLHGFGFGVIQNGLFSTTAKPWLEVRFELDDKENGQPVWHDTYTGQSTQKLSAWDGANAGLLVQMFNQVADDAVRQLIADKAFRSFFEQ
jgi:hypothetical protein